MKRFNWMGFMLLLALLMLFSFGCVGLQPSVKRVTDMTPKERATWMMEIYTAQYDDYEKMVKYPGLSAAQKEMLRQKYDALTKMWPLINTYNTYVDSDALPSPQLEQQIIDLINAATAIVLPMVESRRKLRPGERYYVPMEYGLNLLLDQRELFKRGRPALDYKT